MYNITVVDKTTYNILIYQYKNGAIYQSGDLVCRAMTLTSALNKLEQSGYKVSEWKEI